jgi:PAS domain S-box-containing protein
MMGVNIDISDRKRVEESLRQSEERFRLAIKATNDAIWDIDLKTGVVSWNDTYSTVYGRPPETLNSWQWWIDCIHPDDRERTVGTLRAAISSGASSWTSEYRFQRASGTWADIYDRAYISRDSSGKASRVIGAMQDLTERRQATQKFHSLLEAAPDAIVVVDQDGKITVTNAQVERLFGYNRDELYGKNVEILMPERFRGNHLGHRSAFFQQAKVREMGVGLELYGLPKNGREFPVEISLSPLKTEEGVLVTAAIRDISQRKRAETALRKSEDRLALAQNAAELGVWDLDLRSNVITFWGKYAELHGLSPDRTAITREEWCSLVHPEDQTRVDNLTREARETTHMLESEYRIIWPDMSTHWLHAKGSIFLDDCGKPIRSMGVVRDVGARKQDEARLRESEERFRRVFEEGPLGIALGTTDYRFVKVNSALCKMLGYPEEELLQKTFVDITHPEDIRADLELSERLFKGEIPLYRLHKRYMRKTGEIIWVNLTVSLLRHRESNSLQRLTMIEDVTEAKRNQEQAILRQKLESLGTLAGGIAHDFNNLLGAVLAQTELAQAELAEGSNPEGELAAIRAVATRGSEIVRELLIYAGKESKDAELVDVSQIFKEMLELMKISVSKCAALQVDLSHNLPPIRANTAQISQLVMNLVTNASEAIGDREGTIQVSTQRITLGPDSPGLDRLAEGEYVQLEVSDTGQGMSPETLARVFDPFFSTKSAGRGLGLSVVHAIVDGLGGTTHLASELGRGTTFRILLPRAGAISGAVRKPVSYADQTDLPSQAITILLVEDEHTLREAASKMLNRQGFSVIEASDGSAALEMIRAQKTPIDVLLLDVTLPGTPAREILEEARRLRPGMRVVVTTAYSEEMAVASLQTTFDHFVRKPYRIKDLVELIQNKFS